MAGSTLISHTGSMSRPAGGVGWIVRMVFIVIFLVIGLDGRYTAVNPAWTEVLGHSEEDLVGRGGEGSSSTWFTALRLP